MKVVLEIQEDKAAAFMEIIASIPFVKVKQKQSKKQKIINDLNAAIDELILIKTGKKEARNAEEVIRGL